MKVGTLVHEGLFIRVDVEANALQGEVAADAMREGKWEGGGADGRG